MKNKIREAVQSVLYTNGGAAIASGDAVVVGFNVFYAAVAIAGGATGNLETTGAFAGTKHAAEAIALGDRLDYDVSAKEWRASGFYGSGGVAAGDLQGAGRCTKAALAADVTVEVELLTALAVHA